MDQPYLQFYIQDWKAEVALRLCNPQLPIDLPAQIKRSICRDLWFQIICEIHESPTPGHFLLANGDPPTLEEMSVMFDLPVDWIRPILSELMRRKVCDTTPDGVIVCRKMLKRKRLQSDVNRENARRRWSHPDSHDAKSCEIDAVASCEIDAVASCEIDAVASCEIMPHGARHPIRSDPIRSDPDPDHSPSESVCSDPEQAPELPIDIPKPEGPPPRAVADAWNAICASRGRRGIKSLTDERRAKLRSRIAEEPERRELRWWQDYFDRIANAGVRESWLDFDFAIRSETNIAKILEGKFDEAFGSANGHARSPPPTDRRYEPKTLL